MTFDDFILIFTTIALIVLVNLFMHRDKTYAVFLKDIQNNVIFTLVVKSLTKRKAYETVSKYLIEEGIPFIIGDITNTIYLNNNNVICSNIHKNKK